ncbi:MAG: hypothetical protein J6X83_04380 [Methanomicrobium sp.]|nr:hypothetical protein [Methanomicrobium sp.]
MLRGYKRLLALSALMSGASPVEDTATGNPVTFATDLARPLVSLEIPFTPKQEGTGDPSPQNVRNILPWNGLKVVHLDENMLVINRNSEDTTQGITYTPIKQDNKTVAIRVKGTRTGTNPFFNLNYVDSTTKAIPSGTYKISGGTYGVRVQVFYKDADNVERGTADYGQGATITIPEDAISSWCRIITWTDDPVDTIIYPIITSADSSVTVYPVTFPSPVYGGTLDTVTGVLSVEYFYYQAKWKDGRASADMGDFVRKTFPLGAVDVKAQTASEVERFCNIAIWKTNYNEDSNHYYVFKREGENPSAFVFLPEDTDGETVIQIVNAFVTPQEIQLTPQQITALVGNNTIWSDADGQLTAVYLKKE